MDPRALMFLLSGLAAFGLGAIALGVRFLDGIDMPPFVVASAAAILLVGSRLLFLASRAARLKAEVVFTAVGIWCCVFFVVSFSLLLGVTVVGFSPSDRAAFFYPGAMVLVVAATLASNVLERLGLPVSKPGKRKD